MAEIKAAEISAILKEQRTTRDCPQPRRRQRGDYSLRAVYRY